MDQAQSRISDERLAEIIASDGWSGSPNDITLTARELRALRTSHKRLVEALEELVSFAAYSGDMRSTANEHARAALAEARKLEGE